MELSLRRSPIDTRGRWTGERGRD